MGMSFEDWRKHIDYQVSNVGQWVGILNDECEPLFELPGWLSLKAPQARYGGASVEAQFPVTPGDRLLSELVADGLGVQDAQGRLVPQTGAVRFLAIIREDKRHVYQITHVKVEGQSAPSTLTIFGTDLVDSLLYWPCPSTPHEWVSAHYDGWTTDASTTTYSKARRLARVKFGQKADGHTIEGEAISVLRKIVQDSLDAVNQLHGWAADPHAVVDFGAAAPGPQVLVRTADDFVWDTISKPAKDAGVNVTVTLWWPGDGAVRVRTGRDPEEFATKTWDKPMQIVRIYLGGGR